MYEFKCPACSEKLSVGTEHFGKSGHCNKCGTKIEIPAMLRSDRAKIEPATRVGLLTAGVLGTLLGGWLLYVQIPPGTTTAEAANETVEFTRSYEPAPTFEPTYQLTSQHLNYINGLCSRMAIPKPYEIVLRNGIVVVRVQVTADRLNKLDVLPEELGRELVLRIRNSIYKTSQSSTDWDYIVAIEGPIPGPDLEFVWGYAEMKSDTGKIHWEQHYSIQNEIDLDG